MTSTTDFDKILDEAVAAATAAILAKFTAGDSEHQFNCGFAWVNIDGKEPLANYCRKMLKSEVGQSTQFKREYEIRYGGKGYPSGWQFWAPGDWPASSVVGKPVYQQDMDFKAAGASAFQKVLADYGIRATVGTRLD
jgi:hypothetical protein